MIGDLTKAPIAVGPWLYVGIFDDFPLEPQETWFFQHRPLGLTYIYHEGAWTELRPHGEWYAPAGTDRGIGLTADTSLLRWWDEHGKDAAEKLLGRDVLIPHFKPLYKLLRLCWDAGKKAGGPSAEVLKEFITKPVPRDPARGLGPLPKDGAPDASG